MRNYLDDNLFGTDKWALQMLSYNKIDLTLKRPPCCFSKDIFSKDKLKTCFFVRFNVIISHIFPETFNKNSQIVQKL